MRTIRPLIALVILIIGSISSCKKDTNVEPVISTFYFIRHAEKDRTDPENPDPELNQDGLDRAIRWAEVFDPIHLDAIYSTNYERTSMTAAPTSVKKDIDVKYYDPNSLDIEEFKLVNEGKNVLVVGHSNTTPVLVNKMIGMEKYEFMDDSDNSSLFIVRIIDGTPTDIRLKMD
ncbi:MAG: histidine phosphatase family protein [Muricauda sp.]|nr:histidine phosphatase family protein [Allomuricauda sp.]